jgi:hypothetical protein
VLVLAVRAFVLLVVLAVFAALLVAMVSSGLCRHDVNHDNGLGHVQGDDFEFDTSVVLTDPNQTGVEGAFGWHLDRLDCGHHMLHVRFADPVASG